MHDEADASADYLIAPSGRREVASAPGDDDLTAALRELRVALDRVQRVLGVGAPTARP